MLGYSKTYDTDLVFQETTGILSIIIYFSSGIFEVCVVKRSFNTCYNFQAQTVEKLLTKGQKNKKETAKVRSSYLQFFTIRAAIFENENTLQRSGLKTFSDVKRPSSDVNCPSSPRVLIFTFSSMGETGNC